MKKGVSILALLEAIREVYMFIDENMKMPSKFSLLISTLDTLKESVKLLHAARVEHSLYVLDHRDIDEKLSSAVLRATKDLTVLYSRVPKSIRDKKKPNWFNRLYLRVSYNTWSIQKFINTMSARKVDLEIATLELNNRAPPKPPVQEETEQVVRASSALPSLRTQVHEQTENTN